MKKMAFILAALALWPASPALSEETVSTGTERRGERTEVRVEKTQVPGTKRQAKSKKTPARAKKTEKAAKTAETPERKDEENTESKSIYFGNADKEESPRAADYRRAQEGGQSGENLREKAQKVKEAANEKAAESMEPVPETSQEGGR